MNIALKLRYYCNLIEMVLTDRCTISKKNRGTHQIAGTNKKPNKSQITDSFFRL